MEQMTVTAKVQISVTSDSKVLLDETMSVYSDACNFVSEYVFRTHDLKQFSLNKVLYSILRERFGLKSQMAQSVFKTVLGLDVNEVYDSEGCEHCDNGFHGRIPIHEVLKINQKIRDALSDDAPKDVIRNLVYGESDVTTMLQDGLEKVLQGHTSFGEIVKLIELDDDDQVSGDTSLKQSIAETKTALAAQQHKNEEAEVSSNNSNYNVNQNLVNNSNNSFYSTSSTNGYGSLVNDGVSAGVNLNGGNTISNDTNIPNIDIINSSNLNSGMINSSDSISNNSTDLFNGTSQKFVNPNITMQNNLNNSQNV